MQEKDGHFGTKVDKMARKWIKWQGSDMWHGHCTIYGENVKHVRLQKQAALLQSSMQNNYSYSSCKQRKLFNLGFRNQTR